MGKNAREVIRNGKFSIKHRNYELRRIYKNVIMKEAKKYDGKEIAKKAIKVYEEVLK